MKKLNKAIIVLICLINYSCNGEFIQANFAINLEYPDPNSSCEEGLAKGNSLIIPFKWKPQGNITSFTLVLNNEQFPISDFNLDEEGFYTFDFPVNYNQDYNWQITSNEVSSDKRNFRTPIAEENNNNVPLAVRFNAPEYFPGNESMDVKITWAGGDSDNDGNLRYDAYWSPFKEISPSENSGKATDLVSPSVTFTISNFDSNKEYYILVVSNDGENSASSTLAFRQF